MPTKALQNLYNQIPTFKCKEGCSDCCGPIPFSRSEWSAIEDKRRATSINCPYIIPKKERKSPDQVCAIYGQRPFICRLFGTAPDEKMMRCPHGCKPDNPLTAEQSDRLTKQYATLCKFEEIGARK